MSWERVKISDICEINNGYAFRSDNYVSKNGARVIRITNVQKGKIVDNDPKLYPLHLLEGLDRYEIFEGDIMMSLTGNVGRVGRFPKNMLPAYINQRVCRIKPISEKIDKDFLFYFFNNDRFEQDAIFASTGAAQLNLSTNWVGNYEISLPPLSTQREIVERLDRAVALIENNKKILEQYDQLAQSIFIQSFGDPITNPMGWETDILKNVSPIKKFENEIIPNENNKYWLLNLDAIQNNNGEIINKNMVDISEINQSTSKFSEDNILYSKLRPYLNKVVVPNEKGYCTSELLPLLPNKEKLNKIFLGNLLRTEYFVDYIKEKVAGAKMPRVNTDTLKKFKIILPPLEKQEKFAQQIENIEKQKAIAKQQLAHSEELYQSLLQSISK